MVRWIAGSIALVAMVGCGSADSSTSVASDGTASLALRLQVPKPDPGNPLGIAKPLQEVFRIPDARDWSVQRSTEPDGSEVLTASRALAVGRETDAGIALLIGGKAATRAAVTLDRTPSGGWKYTARLEWTGDPPQPDSAEDDRSARDLLAALPPGAASLEDARAIAKDFEAEIWTMLFGPPEPVLPQMLLSGPNAMQRRFRTALAPSLERILLRRLGDRLSEDQRRTLVSLALGAARPPQAAVPNAGPSPGNRGPDVPPIGISLAVRLPGRVLSHNGKFDAVTGEVYWELLPQALQRGPVILSATSTP
ncbi:MAG: hypothetical protein N2109_00740 [Fimbriimonadales bacterium]|nr:hypothetical protein [Fimbriimonadales bacterium]